MKEIKEYALLNHVPIIRDQTLDALEKICKTHKPKSVLEIGTAIGYSGLKILSNCDCILTTIEKDLIRAEKAKSNFEKYNFINRVNLIQDDALNVLIKLVKNKEKFDLIFLDGPKGQYIKYYPYLKKLLNKNGILFADNVLLMGLVQSGEEIPHKKRSMIINMRKFLKILKEDIEFQTIIYDVEDGYSISKLTKK